MAEDIRMWEIIKGKEIKEIEKSQFKSEHKEGDLEDWLENDITLISEDLLIIGRQVKTAYGGEIDLLCLDENGNVVIIELKRDQTPRDVTAQTLDYASWIKDLSYNDTVSKANEYLSKKGQSLEDAFRSKFNNKDLPEELNSSHRMLIVASELNPETERIIKYLSEEYGVPINFVKFQYFRKDDKQEFLARVFLLDPAETEQRATKHSKRKMVMNLEELLNSKKEIVRDLYNALNQEIMKFGSDLKVVPNPRNGYVDYRKNTTFINVGFRMDYIKIMIKMGDKKIDDTKNICSEIPKSWGYGNMNKMFDICSADEIKYAISLIKQAYEINGIL